MTKKRGEIQELEAHMDDLESRVKALEDAARAFAVVFAVPRLPDPKERP